MTAIAAGDERASGVDKGECVDASPNGSRATSYSKACRDVGACAAVEQDREDGIRDVQREGCGLDDPRALLLSEAAEATL
jgi:hypothetical protein